MNFKIVFVLAAFTLTMGSCGRNYLLNRSDIPKLGDDLDGNLSYSISLSGKSKRLVFYEESSNSLQSFKLDPFEIEHNIEIENGSKWPFVILGKDGEYSIEASEKKIYLTSYITKKRHHILTLNGAPTMGRFLQEEGYFVFFDEYSSIVTIKVDNDDQTVTYWRSGSKIRGDLLAKSVEVLPGAKIAILLFWSTR